MKLVELLNTLLKLIQRALARQEQRRHEATVDEIQNNPGEFLAGHFGGLPKRDDDPDADEAAAKRDGAG